MDVTSVLVALITAAVPAAVTLHTSKKQYSLSKQHSAKQSILQMILEDQVNYNINKELPVNSHDIHAEYDVYHANGGNGEITKRVEKYDAWFSAIEDELIKKGE